MSEQKRNGLDKTIDLSATEEPTHHLHPSPGNVGYSPGVAAVGRSASVGEPTLTFEEPTDVGGPGIITRGPLKQPTVPLRQRLRQLRRGGRWSLVGAAVLVACWGLFAVSASSGDQAGAALALVVILVVGAFLFGLSRLLGLVVLERTFGRVRRSAWVSHAVAGLFWAASGVTYLTRISWLVEAWNWLRGVG
ncbi:hypothetical protein AB0M47_29075 [Hamadaea sp. NPDC051192]|uniref:hypothetical protein n=1 Tax=Hamadaea sp. NPDC051192 TaxID=3154940 RepID=UPI0034248030